jgi:hypothetical protein
LYNVFISKPNWLDDKFNEGYNNFEKFLKTHSLIPRTLGASDYPTDSPLDEVIKIMNDCHGAIILGYPQIEIEKGQLRGKAIQNIFLATEWNHIETGLAYAKSLPILVIHHLEISRGVFDRGTLNKFIYSIDLANPSWSLTPEISGAFTNWKINLEKYAKNNSKIGLSALINILETKGFKVKLDRRFDCGFDGSEIAVSLIIDGEKTDVSRHASVELAKDKSESFVNENYFQYNHWIIGLISEDVKSKLIRTFDES